MSAYHVIAVIARQFEARFYARAVTISRNDYVLSECVTSLCRFCFRVEPARHEIGGGTRAPHLRPDESGAGVSDSDGAAAGAAADGFTSSKIKVNRRQRS